MKVMQLLEQLKRNGKTIIIAAHDKELGNNPLFDHLIELNEGKITSNTSIAHYMHQQ
ncbi:hypothetical protein [Amphibacillus sediminis]|uniref:hypothetical protein n=1 Tax=Amphibacillus sediminis TaxID=360185 RepID=UPI0012ED6DCD|nr:hypothetical protein [Amphibacillus sediminis]